MSESTEEMLKRLEEYYRLTLLAFDADEAKISPYTRESLQKNLKAITLQYQILESKLCGEDNDNR